MSSHGNSLFLRESGQGLGRVGWLQRLQESLQQRALRTRLRLQTMTREHVLRFLRRNAFILLTVSAVIIGERAGRIWLRPLEGGAFRKIPGTPIFFLYARTRPTIYPFLPHKDALTQMGAHSQTRLRVQTVAHVYPWVRVLYAVQTHVLHMNTHVNMNTFLCTHKTYRCKHMHILAHIY